MRRKDREITDTQQIKKILKESDVLRIALNNGKYPYILPVNFGYDMKEDGKLILFFHSSKEGTKHGIIKNNNNIAFEVDCAHKLVPPNGEIACTASFEYKSIVGQGIIEKANDNEKEKLLIAILQHYGISATNFESIHIANTLVYKIISTSYTAKGNIR